MKIGQLFRRDITRRIEEVVKVDDATVIAEELDEYVATDHIVEEMEKILDAYQETINAPDSRCTVWVSGFFGAGKSGWAKVLGYLVGNPEVDGQSACDRFFARTDAPRLRALLATVHAQAPTSTVLLNLATGANVVAREGDSVLKPVYRALLERLGYSNNIMLAELEITLEHDGNLARFEQTFADVHGRDWRERRYTGLARNEASHALNQMNPATYPNADSWARGAAEPEITADWLAERCLELLDTRGNGDQRLLFVVDEAGQYVARSVQRMLDLQGLAEAFQKRRGRLWLVVTSQEKLIDVVDSLESRQVELARARDRFPLTVDLLPSDIEEVTSKRILDKTDAGRTEIRAQFDGHLNQLIAATRLTSPTRSQQPGQDEMVRLYPLLPYQIQLLIDAVSARRTQGGASPTVGGSNRTLIRHAQQLITNPAHGLAEAEVGALVTVDRSYDLLTELIPTSWRAEIEQVATAYGPDGTPTKVLKVVALCTEVRDLDLTADNIAAMLHPHVAAESQLPAVAAAITTLVADDRIRETDDGYRMQSPEQKDWEQTRRSIDLSPGAATRLRRQLLRDALGALTVPRTRAFKISLDVDGEAVSPGELDLSIVEADAARRDDLRAASRDHAQRNRITWAFQMSDDTFEALLEAHRSHEMIRRRDTPTKTATEVELLGEERQRSQRTEQTALSRLARDLLGGQVIFRGTIDDVTGNDLRSTAESLVAAHLDDIYPELDDFSASLPRSMALTVLRTTDLAVLPDALGPDGIGLLQDTPSGRAFTTATGPLARLVTEARTRVSYGTEATGAHLERHFTSPPFGASLETVQTLCAAALRCGLLEVVHQGQVLSSPADTRLDGVLTTVPKFRAAAFRPRQTDTEPSIEVRSELARWLEAQDVTVPGLGSDVLAAAVREHLRPLAPLAVRVGAELNGLGLPVPVAVTRTRDTLDELGQASDAQVVTSTHSSRADLAADAAAVTRYATVLDERLNELRAAVDENRRWPPHPDDATDPSEEDTARAELASLLASDDLLDRIAPLASATTTLRQARRRDTDTAATELSSLLDQMRAELRQRFSDLDPSVVDEALRPLNELNPPRDLDTVSAAVLRPRLDSARARAAAASAQLDEVRSRGALVRLSVIELVPDPIIDEDALAATLDRIRNAVEAHLADGKQVRLQ